MGQASVIGMPEWSQSSSVQGAESVKFFKESEAHQVAMRAPRHREPASTGSFTLEQSLRCHCRLYMI